MYYVLTLRLPTPVPTVVPCTSISPLSQHWCIQPMPVSSLQDGIGQQNPCIPFQYITPIRCIYFILLTLGIALLYRLARLHKLGVCLAGRPVSQCLRSVCCSPPVCTYACCYARMHTPSAGGTWTRTCTRPHSSLYHKSHHPFFCWPDLHTNSFFKFGILALTYTSYFQLHPSFILDILHLSTSPLPTPPSPSPRSPPVPGPSPPPPNGQEVTPPLLAPSWLPSLAPLHHRLPQIPQKPLQVSTLLAARHRTDTGRHRYTGHHRTTASSPAIRRPPPRRTRALPPPFSFPCKTYS